MGLMDRDYMRRAVRGSGSGPRYLMIAAIAIPLAIGAFQLYKYVRNETTPGEGDLIVNVNNATLKELQTIPGVGPQLAKRIIRGQPYARIEDLERVNGIGPYSLKLMRPYVKVDGETTKR